MAKTPSPPKRGRPCRAEEGTHRGKILLAGEKLFMAQGFGATSMDAVAKEAGVSKKSIYGLFDTKEDLFEAIIRSHKEEADALQVVPPEVSVRATFEDSIRTYLTRLGELILEPLA